MEKNVLISLGDARMKDIAEVLGSKSCVRILDLLGEEDLTVSELSSRLKMKLGTVDYNVKKLVDAGLVESVDHWWSVKGRKMKVYRASDRRIVISPRRNGGVRALIWVGLVGVVSLVARSFVFDSGRDVAFDEAVLQAAPKVESLAVNAGASDVVARSVGDVSFWAGLAGWEWFLIGAWFGVFLFVLYSLLSERRCSLDG